MNSGSPFCFNTENWLPKIDGVTRTLARLLEHLAKEGHHAMLFGPEGGMSTFHGHEVSAPLYRARTLEG